MHVAAETAPREDVVECTRCGRPMRVEPSASRELWYYACAGCRTRFASAYDEVLRAGAAARRRRSAEDAGTEAAWDQARARAQRWFERLEGAEPHQVLGLPARPDLRVLRSRYHQLAVQHHPDRGGDPARMREIIDAYKTLRERLAQPA